MVVGIGPLLSDFVDVVLELVVIDQDQVALPLLLGVEELAPVAQVIDEVSIAVDVVMEMTKLPEQGALGVAVAGVEFPHLADKQIVEKEGAVL